MLLPLAVPIAIGIEPLGKFKFKLFNYLRISNQIINENNRFHLLNMLIKKAEGKTFGFAPPKIQFSNQFKSDLRKIYELKPFVEVRMIDFPRISNRVAVGM